MIVKATVQWCIPVTIDIPANLHASEVAFLILQNSLKNSETATAQIVDCIERPDVVTFAKGK